MKFTAQKCDCCDDVALGITCSIKDLQRDDDDNILLTMGIKEFVKVYKQMSNYINGGTNE